MTEVKQPAVRPARPFFSSGPCAKRPGWTPEALNSALVGRSHRSKPGKAKLKDAIERTRKILGIPADYRIGIVPASDTGAMEMAMWSLLGPMEIDIFAWESFGEDWVTDTVKQLKLKATVHKAGYGEIPGTQGRQESRHGISVERHHLRREGAQWRLDSRRPRRHHHLRRHLGGLRDGPALGQARCHHLLLAEGAGRRSGARHAGPVAQCGGAAGKLHAAIGRCRRSSA